MKLGIIFKKEFQWKYGKKQEFFGDEITIRRDCLGQLYIKTLTKGNSEISNYHVQVIQLIYLGEWK